MFASTDNLPTMPKADNEPGSPTSLGYASSDHDHASAGSGFFSRTSSGTSHSSHPDESATEDVVAWRDASPFPTASSTDAERASSYHVPPSSGEQDASLSAANTLFDGRAADHISHGVNADADDDSSRLQSPHRSQIPPSSFPPSSQPAPTILQSHSELDMLKARGEKIPEHIFALRSDTTMEMLRLATDVQKHIAGVEGKVDGHGVRFKAVEEQLGNIQRTVDGFQRTVEKRLESIHEAVDREVDVGDKLQDVVDNGQVKTTDGSVQILLKQSLEEYAKASARLLKQQLDASTMAMEQRLDASAEKRMAAFKEEMSMSLAQFKDDVGDQLREELEAERGMYDTSLALQVIAEGATYDAVVRQVGALSEVVGELQKNLPSTSAQSAPASQASVAASNPTHTPAHGTAAPVSAPTSATSSAIPVLPPASDGEGAPQIGGARPLLEALAREVVRIATKLRRDLGKH